MQIERIVLLVGIDNTLPLANDKCLEVTKKGLHALRYGQHTTIFGPYYIKMPSRFQRVGGYLYPIYHPGIARLVEYIQDCNIDSRWPFILIALSSMISCMSRKQCHWQVSLPIH